MVTVEGRLARDSTGHKLV